MDRPFVFTLPALSPTAGPPEGRSLLAATQAKMGMVPNMHARMASTNVAALRAGTSLPDARLDALSDFTHVLVAMGGRPSHSAAATF